jgi:cytidyltransferase-like protein
VHNCPDCGIAVSRRGNRCRKCAGLNRARNSSYKRKCSDCGDEFVPVVPLQKYCGSRTKKIGCSWKHAKIGVRNGNRKWILRILSEKGEEYKSRLASSRKWAENNKEKVSVQQRSWRLRNKDRVGANSRRRRIMLNNSMGSHTEEEWLALKDRFGGRCAKCHVSEGMLLKMHGEKDARFVHLHRDHVVPISKGGSDFIENIQPLCVSCNSSKHDESPALVYCCGVFDLTHIGHIRLLKRARDLGGYLIVGVVADEAVSRQKGPGRPFYDQDSRLEIVRSMKYVGSAIIQKDFDISANVMWYRERGMHISIVAVGEDQSHVNTEVVESLGLNRVILARTPGVSTSDIARRLESASHIESR